KRNEKSRMLAGEFLHATAGWVNPLQQIVKRKPPPHRHGDFTIQHKAARGQFGKGFDQLREITREGLAGFGLKIDLASVAKGEATEAVPLRLILPAVAIGDLLHEQGIHWREGSSERQ